MAFIADPREWADLIFGGCELGDARRVDRLVDYAARQAIAPAASTSRACKGDPAAHQGAYKLLRNENVCPEDIDDGAFDAVAELAAQHDLVLALQDSTGVSFKHPTAKTFGTKGNPNGFVVHSTLLVDALGGSLIGVVDQQRWVRERKSNKEPGAKKRRGYQEKESFKWESAQERVRLRMADMSRVITVCDREADVYDYLIYVNGRGLRFVQRACTDRRLETTEGRLWETLEASPALGDRVVLVHQRGGQLGGNGQSARLPRAAREALVTIRAASVSLSPPSDRRDKLPIAVNAVLVREENAPTGETPLEWMLLTTEPVGTFAEAEQVVRHYEKRWLIEEFHKAWKSGCRVEERPLQSLGALERITAITAHIAVRIMQLRAAAESNPAASCETVLKTDEWQCLWTTTQHKPLPVEPPTVRWAQETIARVAGWQDTKRTGRIGWLTLWHGWEILQDRVAVWREAFAAAGVASQ